jgi:hypothetical protein
LDTLGELMEKPIKKVTIGKMNKKRLSKTLMD